MPGQAVAPGQHGSRSTNYEYIKLKDLSLEDASSKRVNIWGVVKFFKEPQRSRGTDLFQSFSLVDDSLDPTDPTAKLMCVIFSSDPSKFPQIERIGDIVRLHRIALKPVDISKVAPNSHSVAKYQAVSAHGFSWVVIDGKSQPRSGSTEFTFSSVDTLRVRELHHWFMNNHNIGQSLCQSPQKQISGSLDHISWIDSAPPNSYFDIAVFVVGLFIKSDSCCVLLGTDGSVSTDLRFPITPLNESELQLLRIDINLRKEFGDQLFPITIFDDHCLTVQTVKPGDVVLLKNLHYRTPKHNSDKFAELALHGNSHFGRSIRKLDKHDPIVERLLIPRIEHLRNATMSHCNDINLVGPFVNILERESSHSFSSDTNSDSPSPSPLKKLKKHSCRSAENSCEFEYVTVRDVATQTFCE